VTDSAPRFAAGVQGIGDRCAPSALRRGDQRFATAPPAARWLLLEWAGPWAVHAFDTTPELAALAERANARGVRAVLVRRPGRSPDRASRAFAYVDSRPGREGCWWGEYDTGDLARLPIGPGPGAPSRTPAYLVCTHGRHDACCAIWGRPVALALASARPDRVWECSHIGGDRFAPNVVALPHGFYYGHATPTTAVEIADAYERGRVLPEWLRGRSCYVTPVQAAQHYVRAAWEESGVDALTPVAVTELPPAASGERTWSIRLGRTGGAPDVAVTVQAGQTAPQMLTCRGVRPYSVRTFALVAIEDA
jgi:hypothetical protein